MAFFVTLNPTRCQQGRVSCFVARCSTLYATCLIGFLAFKQVKTVEGVADLQIPPGTQPGDTLVLAKKGVPKLNRPSIRGDHLFTIKVSIPNRVRYIIIFLPFCLLCSYR